MSEKLGYARVSTIGQELEIQIDKLKQQGIATKNIFIEKTSGKSVENRNELKKVMNYSRSGDILCVTKIDRLARSILDLNKIVKDLTDKGVTVYFIDHDMVFKPTKEGEEQDPMQTLLFNILGTFAQFERDLIVSRTGEGRARAKAQGKKMGRKGQPQKQIERALKLYDERENNGMSIGDIVTLTGVPKSTLYNEAKKRSLV